MFENVVLCVVVAFGKERERGVSASSVKGATIRQENGEEGGKGGSDIQPRSEEAYESATASQKESKRRELFEPCVVVYFYLYCREKIGRE